MIRKPIAIALACSVAIHLALFLIADSLLRARAQLSTISTPLVVSIKPSRMAVGEPGNRSTDPETDAAAPNSAETARASAPPDYPTAVETAMGVPAVLGNKPPGFDTAMGTFGVDLQAVSEKLAADDIIATTAIAERAAVVMPPELAPPTSLKAAISSTEEAMFSRKLLEWTDKISEMPDRTSVLTWSDKGQDYVARFSEIRGADDMAFERILVEISTEQDGERLSSEAQFRRLAFSSFAHFVDKWDPAVEIHGDEMDGRFHSNSKIYVAYDQKAQPLFHGEVTTTSRNIHITRRQGTVTRDQMFLGGVQTGAKRIEFPRHFLLTLAEEGVSEDQVQRFVEDARITFRSDGTFVWQTLDSESAEQTGALSTATTYLVADRRVALHIKGTVNGKVLVYSPEQIVIEGDLVYARNPEESGDADDYIGLVSDKNVLIAPPDVTGEGDLLINAAIYARRRFAVQGFRARGNAMLHLYGSLSAGSVSATEPRYYTKIQFDQRLEDRRPPGFPLTNEYEVESWDAAWTIAPTE